MKVLVIEDDEIQHELIGAIFRQIGIDGFFCLNGEDGLEKLANHHFDAVVLDIGLPGKSGVQVLKAIRESKMVSEIPVLILTANKTKDTLLHCMKYGINDYIGKPFQLQQFAQKFSNLKKSIAFRNETATMKGEASKVVMERAGGVVKFMFGGLFNDEALRRFEYFFTAAFKAIIKGDEILLNFAALPTFEEKHMKIFNAMSKTLAPKKPLIVAGRSYGPLLQLMQDYEERLFIVEDDALEYLKSR